LPVGVARRFVGVWITIRRFSSSASKRIMVSSRGRIVSSPPPEETILQKVQFLSQMRPSNGAFRGPQ
jgi:hypothetical protein